MNRRTFVKSAGAFAAVTALDLNCFAFAENMPLKTNETSNNWTLNSVLAP